MSVPHGVRTASEGKPARRFSRQRIETLVYADLGPDNGGFPINISENGMAFQGVLPLAKNQNIRVSFKLPGVEKSITSTAEIVWLNESGKGGGLQFVELPEDSRRVVNHWLSLHRPNGGLDQNSNVTTSGAETMELSSSSAIPEAAKEVVSSFEPTPVTEAPPDATSEESVAQSIEQALTTVVIESGPPPMESALTLKPHELADLTTPYRIRIFLATDEEKRPWIMSFQAWILILVAVAVLGVLMVAQFRGGLRPLVEMVSGKPARPDVRPDNSREPVAEQNTAIERAGNATTADSPEAAPITTAPEHQSPSSPILTTKDPIGPAASPPSRTSEIVQRTTPVAKPPVEGVRSRDVTIAPASLDRSVTPALNTVPERGPEQAEHVIPVRSAAEGQGVSVSPEAPVAPGIPDTFKSTENPVSLSGFIEIIPDPYPSIRVPPELKASVSRPGTILHIGHLVSKIEPEYPKDALRQRISGTVKLHVVIGPDGAVEKAEPTDGATTLASAAVRAVQGWRYEPTMLGGNTIEVEENITMVFRLVGPASSSN